MTPIGIQIPKIRARLGPLEVSGIYPPLTVTVDEIIDMPPIVCPSVKTLFKLEYPLSLLEFEGMIISPSAFTDPYVIDAMLINPILLLP